MGSLWRKVSQRLAEHAGRYLADDYELLPSDSPSRLAPRRRRPRLTACLSLFTVRRLIIFAISVPFLLIIAIVSSGIPPSYQDIRIFEQKLPQHNLTQAQKEHRLYLRFPDHLWGHGLNNILQEA